MAKNLGREFATMDEDERRRFAMEPEGAGDAATEELDFEDPRHEPNEEPGGTDQADARPLKAGARRPAKGTDPEAA